MPTHGSCEAVVAYAFDDAHFGDTKLDGLNAVYVAQWPGAVHQGEGALQVIIDQRADGTQREAMRAIMYGEETEPGSTMFNIFMSMIDTVHDPIYSEIHFEVDVDERTARLVAPDLVESVGEPIRNPVTGATHRARIELPHGFEYTTAEMGSGTSKTMAAILLDLTDSYGQFANLHLSSNGVVR
jgi:hypothetical protein